jgi:hypothetical protein
MLNFGGQQMVSTSVQNFVRMTLRKRSFVCSTPPRLQVLRPPIQPNHRLLNLRARPDDWGARKSLHAKGGNFIISSLIWHRASGRQGDALQQRKVDVSCPGGRFDDAKQKRALTSDSACREWAKRRAYIP